MEFMDFVQNVLALHASPIVNEFRLVFNASGLEDSLTETDWESLDKDLERIETCLRFAIRKKVKILDLSISRVVSNVFFFFAKDRYYILPNSVFTLEYLTKVNLKYCQILSLGQVSSRLLKELNLLEVSIDSESLEGILSGCPSLENLSIVDCYLPNEVTLKSSTLKRLRFAVDFTELEVHELKLKIDCPSMTSLSIHGIGTLGNAVLGSCPNIICAKLEYSSGILPLPECNFLRGLLQELQLAEVVSLGQTMCMVLSEWELRDIPCLAFSWMSLSVKASLSQLYLPGLARILRSCDKLENLEMDLTRLSCTYYDLEDAFVVGFQGVDQANFWDSQEPILCLVNCLKTVEIRWYAPNSEVLNFLKFLLQSAIVLEKLVCCLSTAFSDDSCSGDLEGFHQNILSFPRASPESDVAILFKDL